MKIKIEDLEFKFKLKDDSTDLVSTMTLIIGQFEIRGFRIMKTKFDVNVKRFYLKPPANSYGHNKWVDIFWTSDKDGWKELETNAIQEFDKEHTKYLMSKINNQQNPADNDNLPIENIKF